MSLNYKHLRYFWAVANCGSLTKAAAQVHVSQSALSVQIRKLEEWLGHDLFERTGKRLLLTEAGRIAMDHANTIFGVGDELVSALRSDSEHAQAVLRVGALATLSRNFQSNFLQPLFQRDDLLVVVRSGNQKKLLEDLQNLDCDVVLTNIPPARDSGSDWIVNPLAEQSVSLIGKAERVGDVRDIRTLLSTHPLIVPTIENSIRVGFDAMCDRFDLQPTLRAEVDDMALIRVLARADMGLAVVPPIVVQDELASGELLDLGRLEGIVESFYATTLKRRFPSPLLPLLLENLMSKHSLTLPSAEH